MRTKTKKAPTRKAKYTEQDVRLAAYYRWLERGAPEGDGKEDWFEIENKWRDNIVPENND